MGNVLSRFLAPNGPADRGDQCLLIGVKQTQCGHAATLRPSLTRSGGSLGLMTSSPISLQARYAAVRSAPPGGTRSKGSRILTVVPVGSCIDGMIVPPS